MTQDTRVSIAWELRRGVPLHRGFVAGRYRDGVASDIWTDVTRCAPETFVRLFGACDCGWYGPDRPATLAGFSKCERAWATQHLTDVERAGYRGHFISKLPPRVRRDLTQLSGPGSVLPVGAGFSIAGASW